jgi:hypothetical protein
MTWNGVPWNHCTCKAGAFDDPTTADDMATAMARYATVCDKASLALFFHDGLASREDGVALAQRLRSLFPDAAATAVPGRNVYPYSFVWESDLLEKLRGTLPEIVSDIVFQRVLAIVAAAARSILGAQQQPYAATMWSIMATTSTSAPNVGPGVAATADQIDDVQHAVESDPLLRAAKTRITAAGGTLLSSDIVAAVAAEEAQRVAFGVAFARAASPARLGILALKSGTVLVRMIRRFALGRDHGFHETLVEEILRAYYFEAAGLRLWTDVKAGAAAAFGPDPATFVGTKMIQQLVKLFDAQKRPHVALVAYGAGALYVEHFLAAADAALQAKPYAREIRFDVVVLAPAVRMDVWQTVLARFQHRLRGFRMFSLDDALESADPLLQRGDEPAVSPENEVFGQIYRRSLLYFIAGVLEDDDGDTPLLGMDRFFAGNGPFAPGRNPAVDEVTAFVTAPQRRVLAGTGAPAGQPAPGLRSGSRRHGDFATDAATLESIRYLLRSGTY